MARVLSYLIRNFSNYYTLHCSDLAARAAPLDPRLFIMRRNIYFHTQYVKVAYIFIRLYISCTDFQFILKSLAQRAISQHCAIHVLLQKKTREIITIVENGVIGRATEKNNTSTNKQGKKKIDQGNRKSTREIEKPTKQNDNSPWSIVIQRGC